MSSSRRTSSTKRRKKGGNTLDKYIVFSISSLLIYTIVVLTLSYFDKQVPSELTLGFFGFFGGEIVCSMLIKKYKLQSTTEIELKEGGLNYDIQSNYYRNNQTYSDNYSDTTYENRFTDL